MKADRVVIDTSILISAALSKHGKPAAVLTHVITIGSLMFSRESFREISLKLLQPKFSRYLRDDDRADVLTRLASSADWTIIGERV